MPPLQHTWDLTAYPTDKPFTIHSLPYAHFIQRLPESLQGADLSDLEEQLGRIFLNLLDLIIASVRHVPDYPPGSPSFNVLLSLQHLHIIPRRKEKYTFQDSSERLEVNSLGFAGMLLVKSEIELEAVEQENPMAILSGVGIPRYDVGDEVSPLNDPDFWGTRVNGPDRYC